MPSTKKKPSTDLEAAKALLLWARRERISFQQVAINGVVLTGIVDAKLADMIAEPRQGVPEQARKSIYEEMGGPLFGGPSETNTETVEPTVEDDDD